MKKTACVLVIAMFLVLPAIAQEIFVDTLGAAADAFVDANFPTSNYGDEEFLTLYNQNEDVNMSIFIGFDFSEIIEPGDTVYIDSALLVLNAFYMSEETEAIVCAVVDEWDEMTINYDNQPEIDEDKCDTITLAAPALLLSMPDTVDNITDNIDGTFREPLTAAFKSFFVALITGVTPPNGISFDFYSREKTSSFNADFVHSGPSLIVTYHFAAVEEDETEPAVSLDVSPVSRGSAQISYSLPGGGPASINVFDASGSLVEALPVSPGSHSITYDGSPGVYFMRLETPDKVISKKTVILN